MVYTCTLCGEQMPQEIAATQDDVSWVLPCSFTSILTPFGYRESSITGESTYHQGVDLDTGTGDPVVASRDGVILAANYSNSAGYYVQIDHQDGFRSIYMHLSSYSVSVGQSVSAGQYIGATGATGTTSNEDHLHFGISLNGVYINPENYVDLSVEKEDEIPIDENHFPDEVFRSYVAQNFDTDSNSALSVSECEAVTAINVGNKGIRSLKGIAYFSQLQTLFCASNLLTSLDVSSNTELTDLDCSYNQLTSLDLSNNTSLNNVQLWGNQYTVTLGEDKVIDLTQLPGSFDPQKAGDWSSGTVDGNIYTADAGVQCSSMQYVRYTYQLNDTYTTQFTLCLQIPHTPGDLVPANYTECGGGWTVDYSWCKDCDQQCTLDGAPLDWATYHKDGNGQHTADLENIRKADYTECGGGWTVNYTYCTECGNQCTLGGGQLDWATYYKEGNGKHTANLSQIQKADYTECGGGWTVDYTSCTVCNHQCTLDGNPLSWGTYHKDGNGKHTANLNRIQKANYTECGGGWTVDYTSCTVCNDQCTLDGEPLDWDTYHQDGNGRHTPDPDRVQKANYTECSGGWTVDHTQCLTCQQECTLDGESLDYQKYYKEGDAQHNPDLEKFLEPDYTVCGGGYIVRRYFCVDCGGYCKADGTELNWDTDRKPGDGKHTPNKTIIYQPDYTPCDGGYTVSYYKCSVCGTACKIDGSELSSTDFQSGNGKHTPDETTFHEADYYLCSGGFREAYYECSECGEICDSAGNMISGHFEYGNGKHLLNSRGVCEICGRSITFGTCGENLTWKIENGVLIISGTGDMYDYSQYVVDSAPWLSWKDNYDREFIAVKIEAGVTSIGASSFQDPDFTSIEIPATVKRIGDLAFAWCSNLDTITFAGSAPDFGTDNRAFLDVVATAYYPANDPTWTDDVKKNYGGNITWVAKESTTTLDLTGTPLEGAAEITIDGKQYDGADIVNGKVDLKRTDAKTAVVYSYNSTSDDPHKNYPTGMKVYLLNYTDDGYQVVAVPELDNLLQYKGSSIRMTGNKGIRMITGVPDSIRTQLISAQVAGYTLEEYGTVLAFADQMQGGSLTLSDSYAKSNYAYKRGISDAVYAKADGLTQYTNVLVGFTMDQCSQDIAMRPYIKLKDAPGDVITIYGGIVQRSIGYIAWQNRDTFAIGSDGYNYIWEIIQAVYKGSYPSD